MAKGTRKEGDIPIRKNGQENSPSDRDKQLLSTSIVNPGGFLSYLAVQLLWP